MWPELAEIMADFKTAPVTNPHVDVADQLSYLMGDTGGIIDSTSTTYRLKVYHTRAFPWDDVFKHLLYRGFNVQVTSHKADLFIEAQK
jgi:hypothetical protein